MNYLVVTQSGRTIVRPDITKVKEGENVYLPDFVDRVSIAPVLFGRVSKPGRSVGARFADRYYDSFGYGVLLYPENMIEWGEEGFACASCLDHTTVFPATLHDKQELDSCSPLFTLTKDGATLFEHSAASRASLEQALCETSRFCFLRVGDFVAMELCPRIGIIARPEESCKIIGTLSGETIFDFDLFL